MTVPASAELPTVGIVGVGRVGAVIGAALLRAGYQVLAASGASAASRRRAERLLPDVRLCPVAEVALEPDFVLLCVPDDVLAGLARSLPVRRGQVVAHTSGAHGVEVLSPIRLRDGQTMALHPAMTFTGEPEDVLRLRGISFGVTASAELSPFATVLIGRLGGSVEWIAEEQRALYHAGLAHGANHLMTLVNDAMDLLAAAGVDRPERVLAPLLRAALGNVLEFGDAALTGPVARGDLATVARHLRTMRASTGWVLPTYTALAQRTVERATGNGRLDPAHAARFHWILTEQSASLGTRQPGDSHVSHNV